MSLAERVSRRLDLGSIRWFDTIRFNLRLFEGAFPNLLVRTVVVATRVTNGLAAKVYKVSLGAPPPVWKGETPSVIPCRGCEGWALQTFAASSMRIPKLLRSRIKGRISAHVCLVRMEHEVARAYPGGREQHRRSSTRIILSDLYAPSDKLRAVLVIYSLRFPSFVWSGVAHSRTSPRGHTGAIDSPR